MKRRGFRVPDEDTGIDLTPLIDVVFVVLILFILIAPMLEMDQIQLASAPDRDQSEKLFPNQQHPLILHVKEDNTIWVNKRPITKEQIAPLLASLHEKSPDLTPQLFQDKRARFGTYQMVKNALEEAGFKKVDLVLDPGS